MNAYKIVHPVCAGDELEKSSKTNICIRQVLGTCISIGEDFFITAGHVIKSSLDYKKTAVGYLVDKNWHGRFIIDHEIIEDYDLGIIKANVPHSYPLKWTRNKLAMLNHVQTAGYPYAIESAHSNLDIRAFAGHIVSRRTFHGLNAKPRSYELSFQTPRGLSGAPLIDHNTLVSGLIIGNKSTEILIFKEKEVIDEGKKESTIERYESLQLGVAVDSISILSVEVDILGRTIGDHLIKNELLI